MILMALDGSRSMSEEGSYVPLKPRSLIPESRLTFRPAMLPNNECLISSVKSNRGLAASPINFRPGLRGAEYIKRLPDRHINRLYISVHLQFEIRPPKPQYIYW